MGAGLSVAPSIGRWVRNSLERSKATEANNGLNENELKKTKRLHAIEEKVRIKNPPLSLCIASHQIKRNSSSIHYRKRSHQLMEVKLKN